MGDERKKSWSRLLRRVRRAPRAILFIWSLLPLTLLGGVVALGVLLWTYSSVSDAESRAHGFEKALAEHSTEINLALDATRTEFGRILDHDVVFAPDPSSIESLVAKHARLEEMVRTGGVSVSAAGGAEDILELYEECKTWRALSGRSHFRHDTAWKRTIEAIGDLRAALDSEEGRRRLNLIRIADRYRNDKGSHSEEMLRQALETARFSSMLSRLKAELSELELLCARLATGVPRDTLVSLRDNELGPLIDRLVKDLHAFELPSIEQQTDRLTESIYGASRNFGVALRLPNRRMPMGLFGEAVLHAHDEATERELNERVSTRMQELHHEIETTLEAAIASRDDVAEVAAGALRWGLATMLTTGTVIAGVFCIVVIRIARMVQSYVTNLRQSHRELGKRSEALQTEIDERHALEAQLVEAQKLESLGQLAAGIAHEINTPAQYVSDNTRFLRTEFARIVEALDAYAEQLDSAGGARSWEERERVIRECLKKIDYDFLRNEIPNAIDQSLEGIERISHIVLAMKEFSHPGTGEKEPADLNRAIESTVTVCKNRWKHAADLELDLDPSLPAVPCMLAEFNQVVLNLVVNAADAIEEHLGEGDGMGRIRVSTRVSGEWAEVRVGDNGPGIPASVRERIFDPFFTTKEVGKGTGQGLAISRDVVTQKHGGELLCESSPGEGTEFIVRLPLRVAGAEGVAA